jgi:hypothetical protein
MARRTISIDAAWPEAGGVGTLQIHAAARDIVLGENGGRWSDDQTLSLVLDGASRRIQRVSAEPAHGLDLTPLVGAFVGSGFRRLLLAHFSDADLAPSLLGSLLDALPGISFLSGYVLRAEAPLRQLSVEERAAKSSRTGICAGHTADGVLHTWIDRNGYSPVPVGPPAPVLAMSAADGWHAAPYVRPRSIRRTRRVDVGPMSPAGDALMVPVDEMFRDAATNDAGETTILHEYTVTASADPRAGVLTAIDAEPRVLPYQDCPAAAMSAKRVTGVPIRDLRAWVSANLAGETTCTHLNEALRFLADLDYLIQRIEPTETE